jgi:short-subunit dehydrogenase involved in D-alanine esterification of teichoic acids
MAGIMRVEDWHKPAAFLASAESVLTTNVLGPVRLIAAFIEHLQARPDATIITVSSGLAFTPLAAGWRRLSRARAPPGRSRPPGR